MLKRDKLNLNWLVSGLNNILKNSYLLSCFQSSVHWLYYKHTMTHDDAYVRLHRAIVVTIYIIVSIVLSLLV